MNLTHLVFFFFDGASQTPAPERGAAFARIKRISAFQSNRIAAMTGDRITEFEGGRVSRLPGTKRISIHEAD